MTQAEARECDGELVARLKAGERAAVVAVMRRHNRRLYRLLRAIMGNDPEIEDVLQDAYVKAFTRIGELKEPERLSAWLARIAVNEARQRLRRRARADEVAGGLAAATAPDAAPGFGIVRHPDPEESAMRNEMRRILEGAIDGLSPALRAVFVLRAVEGLDTAETAELLDIPPETVKTRLHRARRALRVALEARAGEVLPAVYAFAGERCDRLVAAVLARLSAGVGARRSPGGGPSPRTGCRMLRAPDAPPARPAR